MELDGEGGTATHVITKVRLRTVRILAVDGAV